MTAEGLPQVRIERTNTLVIISFKVPVIDKRNFAQLSDELDEILRDPKPQTVEIDLTGIRKIDDLGMAFLQSLQESIKDVGGRATLRGSAGSFKRSASATRLAKEIEDRRVFGRPPLGTCW
jgi:anti-anti-sigma regulatory factor